MAKLLVIFVLCTFYAMANCANFNSEAVQAIKDTLKSCAAETNASSDDIMDLINLVPSRAKTGRCLRSCVGKKLGLLDAQGKTVKSVIDVKVKEWIVGDLPTVEKVVDICMNSATSTNSCDTAEEYANCFINKAKEFKIFNFKL